MKKLAITGGLAAGKTTVCRLLESYGAYVVDSDAIVHQLLSPHTTLGKKIIEELGADIIVSSQLDRKKIAQKVFSNPEKLRALERIIHPAVFDEIEKRYKQIKEQKKYPLFVAEIPLLYESESDSFFDLVIAVVASPEVARRRFEYATQNTPEEYERRMLRQMPQEEKSAHADFTIVNNGDMKALEKQVIHLKPHLF